MSVLTPARSGLARAGATRSGYPILAGVRVPLYTLAGVARSGATRSNYHSPSVFVSIGGVHYATGRAVAGRQVDADTLSITDTLNESPNTARCTTRGFIPTEGQEVIITLGSKNNLVREFGGRILSLRQSFLGTPANYRHDLNLIDYTWDLNTRKVRTRYTSTTVAVIAADLIATYAPAFTVQVAADIGAEPIDEITFTEQDLPAALTQLVKRVGGEWFADYHQVVKLFYEELGETNPTILNAVHPTLDKASFSATRDLSQFVTRVTFEGGGVNALASCAVGETILPLDGDPTWYEPTGGVVVSGPQRIRYSGVAAASGGGLVGTGAAPSGAPNLAQAPGAGLEPGPREYAVTFVTGAGESIAGPRAAITSGVTAAPPTAPTVSAPTAATAPGAGPDPGVHEYAVTFLTASGETTPGPRATVTTGETPGPTSYPLPSAPTSGGGVDAGAHDYAVSFTTAIGETLVGPISPSVTTGPLAPPASAPGGIAVGGTPGPDPGVHEYAVTFITASGETTPGPAGAPVATQVLAPPPSPFSGVVYAFGAPGLPAGTYEYQITFSNAIGETTPGGISPSATTTASVGTIHVDLPIGPTGTTRRNIYRRLNQTGSFHDVWVITDNASTAWNDTGAFVLPGSHPPPSVNTAYVQSKIDLVGIPAGGSGVTARGLYRRPAGLGLSFSRVASLSGNSSTTYTDSTTNAGLGPAAPTVNTAALRVVPLTAIPTGESGVTARKLYRRSGGAGLRYLATLSGNSSTTYTDTTPNASLGAAPLAVSTAVLIRFALSAIAKGGPLVWGRNLYRTMAGASILQLLATIGDNTTSSYVDTAPDSWLGVAPPAVATATANQVQLTAIPIGASAVISRKLYRTAAFGSQLQRVVTIADNTTTTYLDVIPDASLPGPAAPASDTSGLTQPQGNVIAGSTSLQIASIGPFPPEGWAVLGNGQQVIRYTGISGNVLTGIPANGPGSIEATIAFNSTVTAAPALTGIPSSGAGSIRFPILKGDEVNLFVQVDGAIPAAVPIVAIGDSLTYGWENPTDATPYTDVLIAHLGPPWTVINSGVPGDHTTGMWQRFQADVLDHHPAYVIIMGGTNDVRSGPETVADMQANFRAMYAAADAAGAIVVACTIWPQSRNGAWSPDLQDKTATINAWIRGFPPHVHYVIDGYTLMGDPVQPTALRLVWDSGDGVHANAAGYTAFGEFVYAAVPWDLGTATPASRFLRAQLGGRADGIVEESLQDRRLSQREALARGAAYLALRSEVLISLTYQVRDLNTRAGRTIRVNLGPPFNLPGVEFLIQSVTVSKFLPALNPTSTVSASSVRLTFDDLLRALKKV